MTWDLVVNTASTLAAAWTIAGFALRYFGGAGRDLWVFRGIWAELKPFYLPAVAVLLVDHIATGQIYGWQVLFDVCYVANWFFFRNADDDDRWKRRKDKVAGKVKALASGRLTVVPAGAS
jgi:hypothetical protein